MPFLELDGLEEREVVPGYRGRFVHTENVTMAYWRIQAGAPIPTHAHAHEQVVNLIEGRYEFTLEGQTRVIEPGAVVVVPPHAAHGGRALTDCRIIDAFYGKKPESGFFLGSSPWSHAMHCVRKGFALRSPTTSIGELHPVREDYR